jgi:hypothetical protein
MTGRWVGRRAQVVGDDQRLGAATATCENRKKCFGFGVMVPIDTWVKANRQAKKPVFVIKQPSVPSTCLAFRLIQQPIGKFWVNFRKWMTMRSTYLAKMELWTEGFLKTVYNILTCVRISRRQVMLVYHKLLVWFGAWCKDLRVFASQNSLIEHKHLHDAVCNVIILAVAIEFVKGNQTHLYWKVWHMYFTQYRHSSGKIRWIRKTTIREITLNPSPHSNLPNGPRESWTIIVC